MVVGFDVEFAPGSSNPATLQLSIRHLAFIFRLGTVAIKDKVSGPRLGGGGGLKLPASLVSFLEDPTVLKAGVGLCVFSIYILLIPIFILSMFFISLLPILLLFLNPT